MKFIILFLISFSAVAGFPPTTLKGQSQSTATTTFNFQVPNNQATKTATGTLVETGSQNLLSNPGFEHSTVGTDWNVTNGTLTASGSAPFGSFSGTFSGSIANGNIQSLTGSGTAQAGLNCLVSAFVKTASNNVQLCAIHNGTLNTNLCVNVNSNNTWAQYQIPTVCDAVSTVARIRITTSVSTTFDADNVFVGVNAFGSLSSCANPLSCATAFSAKISSTGVVTDESLDWINGNCTNATPSVCTFNSSIFTVTPTCVVVNGAGANQPSVVAAATTSTVSVNGVNNIGGSTAVAQNLVCHKASTDYTNAIAQTPSINTVNADYDWTAYTPTSPNGSFGTLTGTECYHKRQGSDLLVNCKFTTGTVAASEARISLPTGLTSASSAIIPSVRIHGYWLYTTGAAAVAGSVLIEPSVSYFTFGYQTSSTGGGTKQNANGFGSGTGLSFHARIPIQGWNNNNVIVGTFAGVNSTPGISTPEIFSFNFGTTNSTTVCSASPCSYLNQIGNAVTNVTRTTTGTYSVNLSKTYTRVICSRSDSGSPADDVWVRGAVSAGGARNIIGCTSSCSSFGLLGVTYNLSGATDFWGGFVCHAY